MNKKDARTRRARQTRLRIAEQRATRLVVNRSNCHIYAQIVAPEGDRVLASASTLEGDMRKDVKNGGNAAAAVIVGGAIVLVSVLRVLGYDEVLVSESDILDGLVRSLA